MRRQSQSQSQMDTSRIIGAAWGLWGRFMCSVAVAVFGIFIILFLNSAFGWKSDWMILIPAVVMMVFLFASPRFLIGLIVGLVSFILVLGFFSLGKDPLATSDYVIASGGALFSALHTWFSKPKGQ